MYGSTYRNRQNEMKERRREDEGRKGRGVTKWFHKYAYIHCKELLELFIDQRMDHNYTSS